MILLHLTASVCTEDVLQDWQSVHPAGLYTIASHDSVGLDPERTPSVIARFDLQTRVDCYFNITNSQVCGMVKTQHGRVPRAFGGRVPSAMVHISSREPFFDESTSEADYHPPDIRTSPVQPLGRPLGLLRRRSGHPIRYCAIQPRLLRPPTRPYLPTRGRTLRGQPRQPARLRALLHPIPRFADLTSNTHLPRPPDVT